jgi:ABC-2 type transport system permease protein
MPIFDQGYQHWNGQLHGRAWRWLAIARHGVRIGLSSRYLRLLLLISWLPAILLAIMLCLWGLVEQKSALVATIAPLFESIGGPGILAQPREFRVEIWTLCYTYFLNIELTFAMILLVLIGPDLISQDLRYNALPLYLSRPLRRIDYYLGKLGVIAAFLGMVIIVPSLLAYVLGLLFSLDLSIVPDTIRILLASIVYGLVIAVSAGTLMLALSSLSRNSRYVALIWLSVWIVSNAVAGILDEHHYHDRLRQARRLPPGEAAALEQEAAASNWRPTISYTANLTRIGQHLLGTEESWRRLSESSLPNQRNSLMDSYWGLRYPWYWSAAVLAVLFGISVCILNFAIKSLDRLK